MIKVNLICIITILLGISGNANAQNDMLDKKQEKIITISALTAKGDLERLKIFFENIDDDELCEKLEN